LSTLKANAKRHITDDSIAFQLIDEQRTLTLHQLFKTFEYTTTRSMSFTNRHH